MRLEEIGGFLDKLAEKSETVYWLSSSDFKKIQYISPAYEKIWGRARDELYAEPERWITFVHPDDVKNYHPIHQMAKRIAKHGPGARYEESYRIVRPDGEIRWIIDRGFPIYDTDGVCCGVTGVAIDITKERAAEAALDEAKLIQEKMHSMKTLAASIAHELRTPLRTVSLSAETIKDHLPVLLSAYEIVRKKQLSVEHFDSALYQDLLSACNMITSEVQEAFIVIEMLLTKLSQTTDKLPAPLILKECSIKCCITEAMRRYAFDLNEKELVHWQEIQDFTFSGDGSLMTHVLFNLLKNALYQIKAARKGDIHVWTEASQDYNMMHFKDTARGVPAKLLPHIFEQFVTQTYHGTGIGLAFCKMVMEGIGGRIDCESKEGQYADFILYFPKDR